MYAQIPKRFEKSSQTFVSSASTVGDGRSDGTLHPGVGGDDEERRRPASDCKQPRRREVHALREPVPTEDPEPEERRLEHEGGESLDRERCAEDVTDELRVDRPVHPELELLHEPRCDADREVDEHERPEEAGEPEPGLVPAAVPDGLHDRDQRGEPQRQRHEEEVIERGRRELQAREIDGRDRRRSSCDPNEAHCVLRPSAAARSARIRAGSNSGHPKPTTSKGVRRWRQRRTSPRMSGRRCREA